MARAIIIILFITIVCNDIYPQLNDQRKQDIKIFIDDSAARYILENPANALEKRDSIWNTFEGYRITLVWHKESSFPITWRIWNKGLNKYINVDTSLSGRSLTLINNLSELEKREHEKMVEHLSSYLPENANFNAFVYLVAFTEPYAFCVEQNKIGIDITGDEWHFDPECLFNMMIHEIYHVGYKLNTSDTVYLAADPVNNEQFISFNYAYILDEGMATYVAYKALNLFPTAYKHDDYKLLEDESKVKDAVNGINKILDIAKTETIDTLNQKLWDVGIAQRAYYVAGAYICKKIEEKFGTEYLADLIPKGALHIIKEYNALVMDDFKINVID